MREILFRGKCRDTGRWYEGYYIGLHKTTYCFEGEAERNKENEIHQIVFEQMTDWDLPNKHLRVDVLPETVGQYTGLTDKNGTKIFEGDIVKEYSESLKKIGFNNGFDFGKVFWYSKDSQFLRTSKVYIDDAAVFSESHNYNIIGNIHDNPELLEGVRNEVNNNESN